MTLFDFSVVVVVVIFIIVVVVVFIRKRMGKFFMQVCRDNGLKVQHQHLFDRLTLPEFLKGKVCCFIDWFQKKNAETFLFEVLRKLTFVFLNCEVS